MISENRVFPLLIMLSVLLLVSGCQETTDESVIAPGSSSKADDALREAEAKLNEAGLRLSFDEPGELLHPEDLLPGLDDLASVENQKRFEEAIGLLNTVLAELDKEDQDSSLGSISDRGLLHLYLGLIYLLDALSRMLISDDPAETFIIQRNPDSPPGLLYTFDVSPEVHAKLDATSDPSEYPLAFTVKERQAIIDAVDLIDDAIAKPIEPNIQPQFSSVDRPPYSEYAVWHFQKAASLLTEYGADVGEAIDEFNGFIDDMRAELQAQSESWGFTYTLPPWR